MVRVKICGITRGEDALCAVEEGASAIGFIFVPGSPRMVTPDAARAVIRTLPPYVTAVGVFVNAARSRIMQMLEQSGIQCLQLHGDESPEDTLGYPVPVYKGFRVGRDFDPSVLARFPVQACLLDSYAHGTFGGTGKPFDWNTALQAKKYGRVILSGGLTPENVGDAIRRVEPYAVDVSSGVEASPGIKDRASIRRLMAAVRAASAGM